MKYKKIISITAAGFILASLVTSNYVRAANLNAAVGTLSTNDEWSVMARAALGQNSGQSFLRSSISGGSATDYEKRILAITAIGENPRTFGEQDFLAKLETFFDGNQIGDANLINDDIFGLLAFSSAGIKNNITDKLRARLLSTQRSDGGWGFSTSVSSDTNMTAMALSALRTTGSAPNSAIDYLNRARNSGSGFGFVPGQAADGASTAWVISGLISAGQPVPNEAKTFLENLQLPNGSFKWHPEDNSGSGLVTAYAVIALSNKSLPIRTVSAGTTSPNPTPPPPPSPNPVNPPPPPASPILVNNASCAGITVSQSVYVSDKFSVTVRMNNTGSKPWDNGYLLGSQTPQDNVIWGLSRVNLAQNTQPGQSASFIFTATAPGTAGNYSFSWRMVQEFVQWFGDTCTVNINVQAKPIVIAPTPPPPPVPNPTPPPPLPPPPPPPPVAPVAQVYVTINYPGNKIYASHVSFGNQTALQALEQAITQINRLYKLKQTSLGTFVESINGYGPVSDQGWQYAVNGAVPSKSAADFVLRTGDRLQWFYGSPNSSPY